ncbi:MAG TPA: TetR/AcrR family transcriptional regulator [Steroidobacteraceae bacterium]|nr:TetR/AcrR family transcriptional regulator [Steroidobacteraceae bacterium]
MNVARKSRADSKITRDAILDATETIMIEEGHGAVTSRRVAQKAGLKSQLVHYHFGTMDDLLVAVYERSEREFLQRHLRAATSDDPLRALWELSIHPKRTRLAQEMLALSNRNEAIRKITSRILEQMHSINTAFIAKHLDAAGVDLGRYPPLVISYLINGVSRSLVTEEAMGFSAGHAQVLAFMERLLSELALRHRPRGSDGNGSERPAATAPDLESLQAQS